MNKACRLGKILWMPQVNWRDAGTELDLISYQGNRFAQCQAVTETGAVYAGKPESLDLPC